MSDVYALYKVTTHTGSVGSAFRKQFVALMDDNPTMAMRYMFWTRDIRYGLGNKALFQILLGLAVAHNPALVEPHLKLFATYGRWDDLYMLYDTPLWPAATDVMFEQLVEDIDSPTPSMLAKWLKSENATNYTTRKLAKATMQAFGLTPKQYRQTLSVLRAKLDIVETKLCQRNGHTVDLSTLPIGALERYGMKLASTHGYGIVSNALTRRTNAARYVKPDAPIRSAMDIVHRTLHNSFYDMSVDQLAQLYAALPNHTHNVGDTLVVTASNYRVAPIYRSAVITCAHYFATHNTGLYANTYGTMHDSVMLRTIPNTSFLNQLLSVRHGLLSNACNIEEVYRSVLTHAIRMRATPADLPARIAVVGMPLWHFDYPEDYLAAIKARYEFYGYRLPALLVWDLVSRNMHPDTLPDISTAFGLNGYMIDAFLAGRDLDERSIVEDFLNDRYALVS